MRRRWPRDEGCGQGEGVDLGNLGSAYADLGEVQRAIGYYQRALEIAREIGDRCGEATGLHSLGDKLGTKEEYEGALACYLLAVDIRSDISDPRLSGSQVRIEKLEEKLGHEELARLVERVEPNKDRIVEEMLQGIAQGRREDAGD